MSIIFEGVDMPTACCFVDGEHSAFAHFEYCKFYNVCKQRETVKTNYKPSDCPVKALEQETVSKEVYDHEYFLRKEFEMKIARLEQQIARQEPQEPILEKIRDQLKSNLRGVEITLEVLVENDPLRPKMEVAKITLEDCLELIDKAEAESI